MKIFSGTFLLICCVAIQSCSSTRRLAGTPAEALAAEPELRSAHTGICVYDASRSAYLYNYQADKYFVPASNTKLFSLFAGMKLLGDSLPGIDYLETDTSILLLPTGDPSFLHRDFTSQPVAEFLKNSKKALYVYAGIWQEEPWGAGWSWDDYNDDYMAERSPLPVYGNVIRWIEEQEQDEKQSGEFDSTTSVYSIPEINWKVGFANDTLSRHFFVRRGLDENDFKLTLGKEKYKFQDVPFITHGVSSAVELLRDTTGKEIHIIQGLLPDHSRLRTVYSRPVDSLFRPMMFRSDNFFAEQTLLMAGARSLGVMNDEKIIDTLLKTDLKDLPQSPHWVDGSGLSRYNLFTPQDFVWLLDKMKTEFGMERMETLLPTGSLGTLGNYFKQDSGFIYAKTGSLSGVIALSGYLITLKNHLFIFSILVNNERGGSAAIRRKLEAFLHELREKN